MKTIEKKRVLLAEDEAPVRKYLAGVLLKNGFDVLEAKDGKEASELYLQNCDSIDAIVSDMRMPNVDGSKFAEFNYENRFFPFIVCTGIGDSRLAIKLHRYGVKDYVLKPIEEGNLIGVIKNALNRRNLRTYKDDDENPYAGNIGSISIPSRLVELRRANRWIENKLENVMNKNEIGKLMNFLGELLLNAHEHGNLKIKEDEKSRLIEEGKLETEMEFREMSCKARIQIDLSVLKEEVAVSITDDGYGFNFDKYLHMDEETLLDRLEMPNGRGIFMAASYFDSVIYKKGGANVTLVKRVN